MIIDNRGKLFGKVSIVDLLIIVIIVAGLLGAYYKFGRTDSLNIIAKTEKVSISFYMEDLPGFVAESIKVGDVVKDRMSSVLIGKVTSVEIGPDTIYLPNAEGKVVVSSKPGYVSIKVTAEGQGVYSNEGVSFSNVDYYVNKIFDLRVGKTNIAPRITSIDKVEE